MKARREKVEITVWRTENQRGWERQFLEPRKAYGH